MTDNPNTPNNPDQYAQQWIDFLRKRNTMLSMLLMLALLFALFSGLAAFYFHQQGQTSLLESSLSKQGYAELEEKISKQEKLISETSTAHKELSADYEKLDQVFKEQESKLGEAESALTVNQEIVDNLNAQLALLKEENEALSGSLSQVRESLLSGASNSEVIAGENKRLTNNIQELNKKLKDRKGAYLAVVKRQKESQSEMERLIDENNELRNKAKSSAQTANALQKQLSEMTKTNSLLQAKLNSSKSEFKSLEDKLNSIMSPIGAIDKESKSKQQLSATIVQNAPGAMGDGLEEIKIQKPRVVSQPLQAGANSGAGKTAAQDNFNYDEISVH